MLMRVSGILSSISVNRDNNDLLRGWVLDMLLFCFSPRTGIVLEEKSLGESLSSMNNWGAHSE